MARSVPVTLGEVETILVGFLSIVTSPCSSVTVRGQSPESAPLESEPPVAESDGFFCEAQALSAARPATPRPALPNPSSERRLRLFMVVSFV